MDEERKARVNAANSKKKIEMDIKDLEEQLEAANRVKEDGLRQLKKYQQQVKDIQRDLDEARHARDEISEQAKENERKAKQLEADYLQMQEVSGGLGNWGPVGSITSRCSGNEPALLGRLDSKERKSSLGDMGIGAVYHLLPKSGNFGWIVNGKTYLVFQKENFPKFLFKEFPNRKMCVPFVPCYYFQGFRLGSVPVEMSVKMEHAHAMDSLFRVLTREEMWVIRGY